MLFRTKRRRNNVWATAFLRRDGFEGKREARLGRSLAFSSLYGRASPGIIPTYFSLYFDIRTFFFGNLENISSSRTLWKRRCRGVMAGTPENRRVHNFNVGRVHDESAICARWSSNAHELSLHSNRVAGTDSWFSEVSSMDVRTYFVRAERDSSFDNDLQIQLRSENEFSFVLQS